MSAVLRSPGSIAFGELAFVVQLNIKIGSVQNREGDFVPPTLKSITAAAEAGGADFPADLRFSLTDAPGKDSYPICGATWAVVFVKNPGARGTKVREFLHWATHEGQEYAESSSMGRLPSSLVQAVEKKLALIQ